MIDTTQLRPGGVVAGGVNPDGRSLVNTLPVGDPRLTIEMMNQEKEEINAAFMTELFQILVDTPRMTATEVIERTREKGVLIAPTVGRQQSEYLGPLVEREIDLLHQLGIAPEMPPELIEAEGEYEVEYDSPLSRAARAEEASGFIRTIDSMTPILNAGRLDILDNFNFDVITRELAAVQGVQASWMMDPETVAMIREQRAKQQAAQQQIEAAPAQASLVDAAAKAKKAGLTEEDLAE